MDASELLETITQLIHQAEQGEIDPWDVQVVEVIDRYIELMAPEKRRRGYETDLSQSGQAFLSASMLVLFKANTLMELQSAEDELDASLEDEFLLDDEDALNERVARLPLEKQLRRRRSAMPPPARRVSLKELIDQLHVMANQLQLVQKTKPVVKKRQPGIRTLKAALELAHQENLTEVAGELEKVLQAKAAELHLGESWMNLEQLVEWWSQNQSISNLKDHAHGENAHTVSVFWALLLLSAQSKVELYQEDFYQEVKIRLLSESTSNPMSQAAS
ncbi:MAG: ScpA family protein [Cyanobacteria bacterium J06628_3]